MSECLDEIAVLTLVLRGRRRLYCGRAGPKASLHALDFAFKLIAS